MRTSVVPSGDMHLPPHVVVIGNQKGGCGKSTFAMHIIVALLKAGKRVASFDLDLNQQTLTRYLANRQDWDRKQRRNLEMPDHYPVKEKAAYGPARTLRQFIAQFNKDGRPHRDDFVVIDTPSGLQHLSLVAHGMADTLITPINDSFFDLDVLVAMESSDVEPQLSAYANMVWRALEARSKISGRATDWMIVRNRLEQAKSNNQRQISLVGDVLQRKLGFRIARGLVERPAYREFFTAGLTVFDFAEEPESLTEFGRTISLARVEIENLIREIGLIEDNAELQSESVDEIEPVHD